MAQHKWHKEIKAWADGAEIEWRLFLRQSSWASCDNQPSWGNDNLEFRIKPQPKEPQYLYVYKDYGELCLLEDKLAAPAKEIKYIGKIKLEEELE